MEKKEEKGKKKRKERAGNVFVTKMATILANPKAELNQEPSEVKVNIATKGNTYGTKGNTSHTDQLETLKCSTHRQAPSPAFTIQTPKKAWLLFFYPASIPF